MSCLLSSLKESVATLDEAGGRRVPDRAAIGLPGRAAVLPMHVRRFEPLIPGPRVGSPGISMIGKGSIFRALILLAPRLKRPDLSTSRGCDCRSGDPSSPLTRHRQNRSECR